MRSAMQCRWILQPLIGVQPVVGPVDFNFYRDGQDDGLFHFLTNSVCHIMFHLCSAGFTRIPKRLINTAENMRTASRVMIRSCGKNFGSRHR
jgi:hypothetical protein